MRLRGLAVALHPLQRAKQYDFLTGWTGQGFYSAFSFASLAARECRPSGCFPKQAASRVPARRCSAFQFQKSELNARVGHKLEACATSGTQREVLQAPVFGEASVAADQLHLAANGDGGEIRIIPHLWGKLFCRSERTPILFDSDGIGCEYHSLIGCERIVKIPSPRHRDSFFWKSFRVGRES